MDASSVAFVTTSVSLTLAVILLIIKQYLAAGVLTTATLALLLVFTIPPQCVPSGSVITTTAPDGTTYTYTQHGAIRTVAAVVPPSPPPAQAAQAAQAVQAAQAARVSTTHAPLLRLAAEQPSGIHPGLELAGVTRPYEPLRRGARPTPRQLRNHIREHGVYGVRGDTSVTQMKRVKPNFGLTLNPAGRRDMLRAMMSDVSHSRDPTMVLRG